MRTNPRWPEALRRLALAALGVAGIASLVASGGGMVSDCPAGLDCSGGQPGLSVQVQPPYATLQVGGSVTYTATLADAHGQASLQWSRSSDGGTTYSPIAGATGPSVTLAAVSLADDALVLRVEVRDAGPMPVRAYAHLAVSATPGLVLRDTEFNPADWISTPEVDPAIAAPDHGEQTLADGGHPGAYRRMTVQIPSQAGTARLFHLSRVALYDPASQGALRLIDYAEDGIALSPGTTTFTESALLLEQAGRRYVANLRNDGFHSLQPDWSANQSRASLKAADFNLVDGPACSPGEACPDFSAQGGTLRFGYWRIDFGNPGDVISHGIDNWQVTLWRQ